MYEIRFHGRGGQGSVMAAQALAAAAFHAGKYAVAFPHFGAERRGAPVLAFARIADTKIRPKTRVYEPDFVVVLDDSLIGAVDVTEGLKQNGLVIANCAGKPEDTDLGRVVKTATVDATSIALKVLGAPVTNSALLGAFAKATNLIKMDCIAKGIMDVFAPRIGEEKAMKNIEAAEEAYKSTVVGVCKGEKKIPPKLQWLPTYAELPIGMATPTMKTSAGLVGIGSFVENKTGSWRTFKPVKDDKKCSLCLFCWFYCPEGCIKRFEDRLEIDYDYCKGCGICAAECPKKAIKMVR